MSFSPHYNKLQLKRRVPKGTCCWCWDFAFHANLLMCAQEIYLRTKSKNKILKPLSQGSIWKANGANASSTRFQISASGSGKPWDDGSCQCKKAAARQRAPGQHVVSSLIFNSITPTPKGLFCLLFHFCFLRGFGGLSQQTKQFFSEASYLRTKTVYYQNRHDITLLSEGLP